MDALVQTVSNELRVSTIDLAAGFSVESRSVHKLVQKYMAEFLEFGKVYQQVGRKAVEELGLARISNPGWEDIKGEKLAYQSSAQSPFL